MTIIDFGNFKLRFDSKDVRVNIDGEMIDVGGARRATEEGEAKIIDLEDGTKINTKSQRRFIKTEKSNQK